MNEQGKTMINNLLLDFEGQDMYRLEIRGELKGFETDWIPIHANEKLNSFRQINHTIGRVPGVTIARARVNVEDPYTGDKRHLAFDAIGSVMADEYFDEPYGGMLFAISSESFRIWVPSAFRLFKTGYVINVADGWGSQGAPSDKPAPGTDM